MAPALLVLMPLLLFARALTGSLVVAGYDLVLYTYPYRVAAARALQAGRLPFWNPDIFAGVPFLANIPSAVFYPVNLLFVWPGGPQMLTLSVVLHLVLTGFFFYAFCRMALDLPRAPSLVGALAFSAGGFAIAHSEQLNQNNALPWVPAVLLAVDRSYRTGRPAWIAALAVFLALEIFAGHPQEVYYTALLAALWLAILAVTDRTLGLRAIGRRLALPVLGAVVGALVAAVQLGPTSELSHYGFRSGGLPLSEATAFSLTAHGILGNLLADYGSPLNTEWAGYVGLVATLLALLALVEGRRTPWVIPLAAAAVVSVLLAMATEVPLYRVAYHVLPGLSLFRVPPRILLISTFALSALAASGAALVDARLRSRRWPPLWPLWAGMALLIVFAMARILQLTHHASRLLGIFPQPVLAVQLEVWTAILVLIAAIVVAARRWSLPVAPGLALLLGGELLLAAQPLGPVHPLAASIYTANSGLQQQLPADTSPYRSLSLVALSAVPKAPGFYDPRAEDFSMRRQIDQPNLPMQSARATADGYEGGTLPLRSYLAFRALLLPRDSSNEPDFPMLFLSQKPRALQLLGLLNVKEILVNGTSGYPQLTTNPKALPRAFMVHTVIGSQGGSRDLATMAAPGFDPATEAILARPPCLPGGALPAPSDHVELLRNDAEAVDITAATEQPGLLVIANAWYPGWTAIVDGRPATVQKVDTLLQGVCVPGGANTVQLRFTPTHWMFYVGLSAIGVLAVLALLALPLVSGRLLQALDRRRQRGDHPPLERVTGKPLG